MTNTPSYFMRDQIDSRVEDIMSHEPRAGREPDIWPAFALVVAAVSVAHVVWMVPQ